MIKTTRAAAALLAVVALGVTACTDEPSAYDRAQERKSAAASSTPTVELASLSEVCPEVEAVLADTDQMSFDEGVWAEFAGRVQQIAEGADEEAQDALWPLTEAAWSWPEDGGPSENAEAGSALLEAVDELADACAAAGSDSLGGTPR